MRFRNRPAPFAEGLAPRESLLRERFPHLPAAALAAVSLLLAGCLFSRDDKVAGGAQDFPNTVALGKAAADHIDDHTGWDQFSILPSTLPGFTAAESLVVAPETLEAAPERPALAKSSAAADTVIWDLSDTAALGVARRIHRFASALLTREDTLTWRYDDAARDAKPGNELLLESKGAETILASGRRTAYRYENTDSAGGFDRAAFHQKLPAYLPAGFKHRLLIMDAAPGGGFEVAAGARPEYYAFARTRTIDGADPDTIESFAITDADGDGTLWGEGDSGTVDFRQKQPNPPLRPAVALLTQRLRAVFFKKDSSVHPVSYRETRTEKDGKQVVFAVHGNRGGEDSTFLPGDTAWVSLRTDFPEDARMIEKAARYRVLLDGTPGSFAGNRLLRYSLEATWRKGDSLASTRFVFTPDSTVPAGELSITGDFDLSADLANGHAARAIGSFAGKIIAADVTDTGPSGQVKRFRAKWDARGEVLDQEAAD